MMNFWYGDPYQSSFEHGWFWFAQAWLYNAVYNQREPTAIPKIGKNGLGYIIFRQTHNVSKFWWIGWLPSGVWSPSLIVLPFWCTNMGELNMCHPKKMEWRALWNGNLEPSLEFHQYRSGDVCATLRFEKREFVMYVGPMSNLGRASSDR